MTSRERVYRTLEFNNPDRVPRDLWSLPWAHSTHPNEMHFLKTNYDWDFDSPKDVLKEKPKTEGDAYKIGTYIDEWGCNFTQKMDGIIGEVKETISKEEDFSDFDDNVHIPVELLTVDKDKVNAFCKSTDKFVSSGCCPRIFEQMQFIRGTEQFYMDLMIQDDGLFKSLNKVHEFYKELLEVWAKTDVDSLSIMDDWGAQRSLLINPKLWREIFKPMYKDYCDIAKKYNKKIFMHSDGYILDIYPDLIEIGIDALNSQIFCMGIDSLKQYAGQITFWGEIDRQYLLPNATTDEIDIAVKDVYNNLYKNGGCIAQCEFGPGAKPENVIQVFDSWSSLR